MKEKMVFKNKKTMKMPNGMKGKGSGTPMPKAKSMAHLYDDKAPKHMKK